MKKILLLLVFVLLVTACGQSSNNSSTSSNNQTPQGEKTFTFGLTTDIMSLDTNYATDGTSFSVIANFLVGLVELDEHGQAVPGVASSWDESADKTEYVFHLNPKAVWSNDKPVTAHDFVYSWKRLVSKELASEYAFLPETANIQSYEAVDDHTLKVKLSKATPYFLGLMAFPSFFPVNEEFVKEHKDNYATKPEFLLSNGPFVLSEHVPGNSATMVRNPKYFKADEVKVDKVVMKLVKDTQSSVLAFENKELDLVPLSGELVERYKGTPEYQSKLFGYLWYIPMNFQVKELQNLNLRKALSLSVDRENMANLVLKDGSVAADGFVPKELAFGPDGKDFRETSPKLTTYNVDEAKKAWDAFLSETGKKDLSLELLFEDTEASKTVAEFMKSTWEKALPGLTINLKSQTKKARISLMQSHDYQLALHRWGPDFADPKTYMDLMLKDSSYNFGGYQSEKYNQLVNEANTTTDVNRRWELFKEAEKVLVVDEVGVIPVYQNGGAMLQAQGAGGAEYHSGGIDVYRRVFK